MPATRETVLEELAAVQAWNKSAQSARKNSSLMAWCSLVGRKNTVQPLFPKELDAMSIATKDIAKPLLQFSASEELLEVVTHAVAKLDLAWPAVQKKAGTNAS
ncbi:hypothetical protein Baya_10220 [Bagarius yarrelli]|uniref:Uncharacterized protein n=1 Tax=Bagarius yarrelli TaxID=175774 RepID=A0A556UFF8_BAGYA|nr:hypothetical protein Baya_10220 [Bagarius yarrelli]